MARTRLDRPTPIQTTQTEHEGQAAAAWPLIEIRFTRRQRDRLLRAARRHDQPVDLFCRDVLVLASDVVLGLSPVDAAATRVRE